MQQRFNQIAAEQYSSSSSSVPIDAWRNGRTAVPALQLVRAEFQPQTWQAFWQVAVDGPAAADVAAELGANVRSVYVAKSRILRRLREELCELEDI